MIDNNDKYISVEFQIKSIDYYVNMFLCDSDQKLVVELGDMHSADMWKGVFESNCQRNFFNTNNFVEFKNYFKTIFFIKIQKT